MRLCFVLSMIVLAFLTGAAPACAQNDIMKVIRQSYERQHTDWFQFNLFGRPAPEPQRPAPDQVKPRPAKARSPFQAPRPAQEVTVPAIPVVPPSIFVSVIGDSLADLLADGLKTQLADRPDIAVTSRAKSSSGLVRDDFYDWTKAISDLLASGDRIDAAVIMIGTNDRQQMRNGDATLDFRTDTWKAAYVSRIDGILTLLKAKNIKVVWVGLPPMKNDKLTSDVVWFNEIYKERTEAAGGTYLDIWDSFVDADGAFAMTGPDINGQVTKLRAGDGVHFSKAGAQLAAHYPEKELRHLFGEAPMAAAPTVTSPLAPDSVSAATPDAGAATPGPEGGAEAPKPEFGPVMPLETVETSPNATLLGNGVPLAPAAVASTAPVATPTGTSPAADPSAAKVLQRGEPLAPRDGRADDFRWPRTTPSPDPIKTSSAPTAPAPTTR